MESLSPNLFVKDINETIEFYKTLGFQTFASLGDTLPDVSRTGGGSLLLYIKLKNIRSLFDSVKDKITVLQGLEKTFYGATEFSIKDNNGFLLTFAEDEQ